MVVWVKVDVVVYGVEPIDDLGISEMMSWHGIKRVERSFLSVR